MDARRCAEIVRELRETARRTTNRRLALELKELADMWDEVRAKAEGIEQRALEDDATPEDGSRRPQLNGKS